MILIHVSTEGRTEEARPICQDAICSGLSIVE